MATTTNLGIELTGDTTEDLSQTFQTWRKKINGLGEGSAMQIIDEAVGNLQDQTDALIKIQDTQPIENENKLWVDPSGEADIKIVPQIKDNEVSTSDTWSSAKIQAAIQEAIASALSQDS